MRRSKYIQNKEPHGLERIAGFEHDDMHICAVVELEPVAQDFEKGIEGCGWPVSSKNVTLHVTEQVMHECWVLCG